MHLLRKESNITQNIVNFSVFLHIDIYIYLSIYICFIKSVKFFRTLHYRKTSALTSTKDAANGTSKFIMTSGCKTPK